MADRPRRLTVVGHDPTAEAARLVFGDHTPVRHPVSRQGPAGVGVPTRCGPEPACAQTAAGLGSSSVEVAADLRGPDFGAWTGRGLAEVGQADPAGLAAWLTDPDARGHGGETVTELVARVAGLLAGPGQPAGPAFWVVTPLVARALAVAALGAPAAVLFSLEVGFGGRVVLSGAAGRWRLQGLSHRPR